MGPLFAIVFWLILAAIYGAVFLVFAGVWLLAFVKKWRVLKWCAGVPAAGMLLLAVLAAGGMAYLSVASMNPRSVFKQTFHESPPATVSGLQSSFYSFGDCTSVYMKFTVSEAEFQRLVPAHLSKTDAEKIPNFGANDPPAWWHCQPRADWLCYKLMAEGQRSGHSMEWEFFAYDPATGTAYFYFSGID